MFALRSPFDYGFGFPRATDAFFDDSVFEPSPFYPFSAMDYYPVVYRPVNRRAVNQRSQSKRKGDVETQAPAPSQQLQQAQQQAMTSSSPEQKSEVAASDQATKQLTLPEQFQKALSMHVRDEDSRIVLKADLHGVPQDQIDLSFDDGCLRLKATRQHEHKDGQSALRYHESLNRVVPLPKGVDESQISASYRDGVLEVVVPKPETARRKRIQISGAPAVTSQPSAAASSSPAAAPAPATATPAPSAAEADKEKVATTTTPTAAPVTQSA